MVLQRMKSKFFKNGSSASSSHSSSSSSAASFPSSTSSAASFPALSRPKPVSNRPPLPPIQANVMLHVTPPDPRQTQKIHKSAGVQQVAYVTAEDIRDLRDLMRYRYALDGEIWEVGKIAKSYQRDTVIVKMKQADAAMAKIRTTLDGWDRPEFFETVGTYDRFREIKNRILEANPRNWETNPPWAKPDTSRGIHEKDGRPIQYMQYMYR